MRKDFGVLSIGIAAVLAGLFGILRGLNVGVITIATTAADGGSMHEGAAGVMLISGVALVAVGCYLIDEAGRWRGPHS